MFEAICFEAGGNMFEAICLRLGGAICLRLYV